MAFQNGHITTFLLQVMPLPIFPKSRKCKSMNNVNNGRHGITKPRITGKYNNNPNISAKQALTKEISHWQELVIMSQNKQLEVVKIPKEEAKLGCNSSCKICNENDHCIAHAFNKGSIDKVIVSKTRDLNKFNGKTDTKSHLKINLKRDATHKIFKIKMKEYLMYQCFLNVARFRIHLSCYQI